MESFVEFIGETRSSRCFCEIKRWRLKAHRGQKLLQGLRSGVVGGYGGSKGLVESEAVGGAGGEACVQCCHR